MVSGATSPVVLLICNEPGLADDASHAFSFCMPEATLHTSNSGHESLKAIPVLHPDLIVLDLDSADLGISYLKEVKRASQAPILTLSYMNDEGIVIEALENGSSQHESKPIHQMEFIARVKAILRTKEEATKQDKLTI